MIFGSSCKTMVLIRWLVFPDVGKENKWTGRLIDWYRVSIVLTGPLLVLNGSDWTTVGFQWFWLDHSWFSMILIGPLLVLAGSDWTTGGSHWFWLDHCWFSIVLIGPLVVLAGSDWTTVGSQLVIDGSSEKSWYAPITWIGESWRCGSGAAEAMCQMFYAFGAQKCFRLDNEPKETSITTSVTLYGEKKKHKINVSKSNCGKKLLPMPSG